jgi:uncharacterized membrane protein
MQDDASQGASRMSIARRIGLAVVFAFFLIGGIAHFAYAAAEISIIPPYVPHPHVVNAFVGACELLGAAGLLLARWRRAAGLGLILLALAVTPANVFMLQHAERYPDVPLWLLVARLPLLALLILLIAWSSRAMTNRSLPPHVR